MAIRIGMSLLLVLIATMFLARSEAQPDCVNTLVDQTHCRDYVSRKNKYNASSKCCTQLNTVVEASPQCLCQVNIFRGSEEFKVNQTSAYALLASCGVIWEDVKCRASSPGNAPAESPDESPEESPEESPDESPDESPEESPEESPDESPDEKIVPSGRPSTNEGSSNRNSNRNFMTKLIVLFATLQMH